MNAPGFTVSPFILIPPNWAPLPPGQSLDAGVSTALALPTVASVGGVPKGAVYYAVCMANGQQQWLNFDGTAAAANKGILLAVGAYAVIGGYANISLVRFIHAAGGGTLSASFFYTRD